MALHFPNEDTKDTKRVKDVIRKLENELEAVNDQIRHEYRNGFMIPRPALTNRRQELEEKLEKAKQALPQRLSDLLPSKEARRCVTFRLLCMFMAFDFASEMAARFTEELERFGIEDEQLFPSIGEIAKAVDRLAGRLCETGHPDVIGFSTGNDRLISDCRALVEQYVKEKTSIS